MAHPGRSGAPRPRPCGPAWKSCLGGRPVALELRREGEDWHLQFGQERTPVANPEGNLRPALERHLRHAARVQLVRRARELAREHPSNVKQIVIRNQRSRWGSCSCHGTISLNWRLIQLPDHVRDYIIIHEINAFGGSLNHSTRFWREVARPAPITAPPRNGSNRTPPGRFSNLMKIHPLYSHGEFVTTDQHFFREESSDRRSHRRNVGPGSPPAQEGDSRCSRLLRGLARADSQGARGIPAQDRP